MALATNSYSTIAEVEALVRHLLDGEQTFTSSTSPRSDEVESIIDRVSGVLNTALAASGFSVPVSNATSVLACAEWVIRWTIVELRDVYPHLGIAAEEVASGADIFQAAFDFVTMYKQAFKNLGETVSDTSSSGLTFTALEKHSERSDPDDTDYEQPMFRRRLFEA